MEKDSGSKERQAVRESERPLEPALAGGLMRTDEAGSPMVVLAF